MRHAESVANALHIIVSDPKYGVHDYGLTPHGHMQVKQAIEHFTRLEQVTCIYASDFLRAYQTAAIISKQYGNIPLITDLRLRERYFGQFESTNSKNYEKIWDMDCSNTSLCYDVESIVSVVKRMMSFIRECEKKHNHEKLLIVSHGDPLQILFTISLGFPYTKFRSLPHFANAEIRVLPHIIPTSLEVV